MGCHFLLQGIFQTQGSNLHHLHWQMVSLLFSHQGSPFYCLIVHNFKNALIGLSSFLVIDIWVISSSSILWLKLLWTFLYKLFYGHVLIFLGQIPKHVFCDRLIAVFYGKCGEGNGTPLQYSCLENPMDGGAWKAAVHGVAEGRIRLSNFTFTFHFHALEKEMATHSSVLAWRISGTVEPGELPSLGSHRVGHDWSDLAAAW